MMKTETDILPAQGKLFWISALALSLAVAGILAPGWYVRFLADDFCMAADARQMGLLEMLSKWYNGWTGRFAFILGTGLLGQFGPEFARIGLWLTGIVWLLAFWWAILPLFQRAHLPHPPLLAWLAASLFLVVLLASIPNVFQSFYWQDGMVNYTWPLIGLTLSLGLLARVGWAGMPILPAGAALFLLAFLGGGFTEAFSAMQIVFFGMALLTAFLATKGERRAQLLMVLTAALLGSLLALVIVVAAPGNAVRMQAVGLEERPGLFRIVTFSLRNMAHIFGKYFLHTPVWALASIHLPFSAGWLFAKGNRHPTPKRLTALLKQDWARWAALVTGTALILVTAACAPVVYAMNAYPDDRTIIVPQFVVVAAVMVVSALLGTGLRQTGWLASRGSAVLSRWLPTAMLLITLAISGLSLWRSAMHLSEFRLFAQHWDQQAALIQQAIQEGKREIVVPGGDAFFEVANLGAEADFWVNRCMAEYYGVDAIIGR